MGLALRVGRPDDATLERAVLEAREAELTYSPTGRTLDVTDHDVDRARIELGAGAGAFEAAVDGIRRWACHAGIGARVHPPHPPITVGTVVVVALPVGPGTVLAPTRIVGVVADAHRFGFAYGTLPGHPERGEESFVVERRPDGSLVFTVSVLAEPIRLLRPVAPLVRIAQRRAIRGYLRALEAAVSRGRPGAGCG